MIKTFYRVCNTDRLEGLWYDTNGKFTGLIHTELSFCANSGLVMDFDDDLVNWLSATDSLDILYGWFPLEDILRLQKHGWCIHVFESSDYRFYEKFQHYIINQSTCKMIKKIMKVQTQEDIPDSWQVLKVRKKTTVKVRSCEGVEEFDVSWQDSKLISDPAVDVIIIQPNGVEFPCKREIFNSSYIPLVGISDVRTKDVHYIKNVTSQIVPIPIGETVQIETLEGTLNEVTFPDYIAIGIRGELYANTFEFVRDNLEFIE